MDDLMNAGFGAWEDKPKPKGSASLASVVSAFLPTWATGLIFLAIFIAIRHRYRNIYSPRTYMGTIPEKDRTPSERESWFDWFHTMRLVPDKFVLYHGSLDSYLYLRFLRTGIFICVVGCVITWPILMPINATGGGTSSQLDKIGIGNVKKHKYLYAHAVVAWMFFSFIMFLVARERLWLIGLRQAWNLSTPISKRLSSRTVLFLSAPKESLKQENMRRYFGDDAVRLWAVTKADVLGAMVADRDAKVEQLEAAEAKLIYNANKKAGAFRKRSGNRNDQVRSFDSLPDSVKRSLRPTHRPKYLPPKKKVDSIDWLRKHIKEREEDIQHVRENYEVTNSHGAAAVFVEFQSQLAAQRAYQQVASSEILALSPRYSGVLPQEVIWDNLTIPPASRISQEYLAHALVAATILWWSIPTAVIGAISNISYLAENVKWLEFLKDLPDPLIGLLTGLVPPLLTSLLSTYVPNIFRYIAKRAGEPTNTSAELKVQKWYYIFQVTQVFLITTFSSGAAAVASEIAQNPGMIPDLLAERLPRASNFYLTYFIIQGTTAAANNMLNQSDLLSYLFFDTFFDRTPRQKFNRYTSMKSLSWGKVYPKFANFAIIAIAYSCIAPLVLGFAALGLSLYYYSYRHNLLFVLEPSIDTKGHAYTLALQHLLTGLYIAELALLGIFGLDKATGPAVMIIILLIVTVVYNFIMNKYFTPLERYLPADLAREVEDGSEEQTPLLSSAAEEGRLNPDIQHLSSISHLPPKVLDPIARFFEPRFYASHRAVKSWLEDGDWDDDDEPRYEEDDVRNAYTNPAFSKEAPLVWLPRDEVGVSKKEVEELEGLGLRATDRGAWLDERGVVRWDKGNFGEVPVWGGGVRY